MPFIPNIGPGELILILIIALVVLGPGKLPDVAQSLGRSLREFRKAASDVQDAAKIDTPPPAAPAATPTAVAPATPVAPVTVPEATAAPAPNTLSNATEPNTLASGAGEPVQAGSATTPDSSSH